MEFWLAGDLKFVVGLGGVGHWYQVNQGETRPSLLLCLFSTCHFCFWASSSVAYPMLPSLQTLASQNCGLFCLGLCPWLARGFLGPWPVLFRKLGTPVSLPTNEMGLSFGGEYFQKSLIYNLCFRYMWSLRNGGKDSFINLAMSQRMYKC